jgi:hypothetical protein
MALNVQLEPSPEVQCLGDAVVIRGMAALDVYRLLTEGIAAVRRRDAIEPNDRLLRTVAALKAASLQASSASTDIADVRRSATPAMLRTGKALGLEEVARMLGVGPRHARRLAPTLGGVRVATRGRPWRFDEGLVRAYIESEGTDL